MKKRVFTSIIALLAMVGMARAATNYGIQIGSTMITSDNYQNLNVGQSSGTISFDPTTATLTLDNFVYDKYSSYEMGLVFTSTMFPKFKLKLVGTCGVAGRPYSLELLSGTSVEIEGSGKLTTLGIYMESNTTLNVSGSNLAANSIDASNNNCNLEVFGSIVSVISYVHGISKLTMVGSHLYTTNIVLRDGNLVDSDTGNDSLVIITTDLPPCDYDKNNVINGEDIDKWFCYKVGATNYAPYVNAQNADLFPDGKLSASDLVMFGNYMLGTRKPGWVAPSLLVDVNSGSLFLPNMGKTCIYSSTPMTQTWALMDYIDGNFRARDDRDASHFYCYSSDSDIAQVSVAPIVESNITFYGYQVTVKKSGSVTITLTYDDKAGNSVEMKVPLSCFSNSEVLASGDKLYGTQVSNNNGYQYDNFELRSNMDVPVGVTMHLTIDRAVSGTSCYDNETRKQRIACTTWEVFCSSSTDNVTLEKDANGGCVNIRVKGPGAFTVTATDKNNNKRTATFVARDVYTHSDKAVFLNGDRYLDVPKPKGSETLGISTTNVETCITKMITCKGNVFTLVNHGLRTDNSLLGQTVDGYSSRYVVPVCAQVFCNQDLIYESDATFLEDIAFNNSDALLAVGWTYDPDIQFGKYEGSWSGDALKDEMYSLKVSGFYALLNLESGDIQEYTNPIPGQKLENKLQAVAYDPNTNEWCLLGYASRKKTAWNEVIYPHDWFFQRWTSDLDHTTASYRRKANNNYTYAIKGLTFAYNRPVGLIGCKRYKHTEAIDMFLLDKYLPDMLFYDFSKTEDEGTLTIDDTVSSSGGTYYPMAGITAADETGSLHGWRKTSIYDFSNNLQEYEVNEVFDPADYKILQLKYTKYDTYKLVSWKHSLGTVFYINSVWGNVSLLQDMPRGFDLMIY